MGFVATEPCMPSLPAGFGSSAPLVCVPAIPCFFGVPACPPPPPLLSVDKPAVAVTDVRFSRGDARALPTDPHFWLESTNFRVDGHHVHSVGNKLLDILISEGASINKVSLDKFSIKATICQQGLTCDMKVRLYRKDVGHVVEFQRRSGDALVFARVYNIAVDTLMCVGAGLLADEAVNEQIDEVQVPDVDVPAAVRESAHDAMAAKRAMQFCRKAAQSERKLTPAVVGVQDAVFVGGGRQRQVN